MYRKEANNDNDVNDTMSLNVNRRWCLLNRLPGDAADAGSNTVHTTRFLDLCGNVSVQFDIF